MGRKKKPACPNETDKKIFRPFCFYCDKEYPDEDRLILHQRAVHFKCPFCVRKFDNIAGLVSHALAVHAESLTTIPHALDNRRSISFAIVGMSGVPLELIAAKAVGTDLEKFILDQNIHLHPVFKNKLPQNP